MEIVVNNVNYLEFKDLSFKIVPGKINAITGNGYSKLLRLLGASEDYTGEILYDNKKLSIRNKLDVIKEISYIDKYFNNSFSMNTVESYMNYYIFINKLDIKDPSKKIIDSLKIVGLKKNMLYRDISSLTSSEKKLFQLAVSLLSNPKIIILDDFFDCFDSRLLKKTMILLNQLNERFDISIIFGSNNSEIIYKYSDHLILLNNNKILLERPTKEIYQEVAFLTNQNIEVPDIARFTYLVKNKDVDIDFCTDIRDLIKDIYKHV